MSLIDPRTKVLQHLDHLIALRDGINRPPVNIEIDLSNRCDLKCAGCHFAYTHTRGPWAGKADKPANHIDGGDVMPTALAMSILDQFAQVGVKSVTWTGGGEPTLHPRFDDIITHAAFLGLEQGLYTHGGHISAARAGLLKQCLSWVYISLDAHDGPSYAGYKGVDRWAQVTAGIMRLVDAEGDAKIGIGFLLGPDNYHLVDKYVESVRDLGADYVQFRPMIEYRQDAPGVPDGDTTWATRDVLPYLASYRHDPFVIADVERFRMYGQWAGHGYDTCRWSAIQTVVTPNGKVWRCVNKREHAEALLGDLDQERFEDIWARMGGACAVDGQCRVMCRGHIANQTMDQVFRPTPHLNFV